MIEVGAYWPLTGLFCLCFIGRYLSVPAVCVFSRWYLVVCVSVCLFVSCLFARLSVCGCVPVGVSVRVVLHAERILNLTRLYTQNMRAPFSRWEWSRPINLLYYHQVKIYIYIYAFHPRHMQMFTDTRSYRGFPYTSYPSIVFSWWVLARFFFFFFWGSSCGWG